MAIDYSKLPGNLDTLGNKGFYDWTKTADPATIRAYGERYGMTPTQLANAYNAGGGFSSGGEGYVAPDIAAKNIGANSANDILGNYWKTQDPKTGAYAPGMSPTAESNYSGWSPGADYDYTGKWDSVSTQNNIPTPTGGTQPSWTPGTGTISSKLYTYKDFMPEVDSSKTSWGLLKDYTSENNPLVKSEEAAAERAASKRGLQNTLVAVKAGRAAAINAAAPFAQQDASTIAQLMGQAQQGQIQSAISSQASNQDLLKQADQFRQQAELYKIQGDINSALQAQANAEKLEQIAAGGKVESTLSTQSFVQAQELSKQDATQAAIQSTQDFNEQSALETARYTQETAIENSRQNWESLMKLNDYTHDIDLWQEEQKNSYGEMSTNLFNQYLVSRTNILTNPDLNESSRYAALNQVDEKYRWALDNIASVYGVQLSWTGEEEGGGETNNTTTPYLPVD